MNILVVEDEAGIRQTVVEYLGYLGHEVHQAADGQEAFDLIQDGLRPDIIISDIQMPRICGARMLAMIRVRLGLKIPVIFISGGCPEHKEREIREMDAPIHRKPFSLRAVPALIEREMSRQAA